MTPGEIMQLPPADALVLVSGIFPIRAKKARYYEDRRLQSRVLSPPMQAARKRSDAPGDDWSGLPTPKPATPIASTPAVDAEPIDGDPANAGIRQEPELPAHEAVDPPPRETTPTIDEAEPDDQDAIRARTLQGRVRANARQAAMDPDDGIAL